MEQEFIKEIKKRKKELETTVNKLTIYWMNGMFQSETNFHIGRTLDFMNKSILELQKLIE